MIISKFLSIFDNKLQPKQNVADSPAAIPV